MVSHLNGLVMISIQGRVYLVTNTKCCKNRVKLEQQLLLVVNLLDDINHMF